jgi:hypothetical protein
MWEEYRDGREGQDGKADNFVQNRKATSAGAHFERRIPSQIKKHW